MADPTGEADKGGLRLDFDRRLLLQFRGSTITPDAGLLPYRELDDAMRLKDMGADTLADAPTQQERSASAGGTAAPIGVRAAGRLRGRERRGAAVPRSEEKLFRKCEPPHTSQPIPERCCIRVFRSGRSSGEYRR